MDQITPLDIDANGNMYFEMLHGWNAPVERPRANVEPFPIDLSLVTTTAPLGAVRTGPDFYSSSRTACRS